MGNIKYASKDVEKIRDMVSRLRGRDGINGAFREIFLLDPPPGADAKREILEYIDRGLADEEVADLRSFLLQLSLE